MEAMTTDQAIVRVIEHLREFKDKAHVAIGVSSRERAGNMLSVLQERYPGAFTTAHVSRLHLTHKLGGHVAIMLTTQPSRWCGPLHTLTWLLMSEAQESFLRTLDAVQAGLRLEPREAITSAELHDGSSYMLPVSERIIHK